MKKNTSQTPKTETKDRHMVIYSGGFSALSGEKPPIPSGGSSAIRPNSAPVPTSSSSNTQPK